MPDRDDFLRELHHRVKNNFQIIASLMNLQKRMLPPERRNDLRFVEEHVQSMAVAYRIVSASTEMVQVPIDELVREVGDNLRQIAGARDSATLVRGVDAHGHFDHETRPLADGAPEAMAAHAVAVGHQVQVLYRGTGQAAFRA